MRNIKNNFKKAQKSRIAPLIAKITFLGVIVIGGAFLFLNNVQAAAGDVQLTVTTELAAGALSGATVTAICTGHSSFSMDAVTNASGVASTTQATVAASGCLNGEVITFTVAKDGYVTKSASDGHVHCCERSRPAHNNQRTICSQGYLG